MKTVNAVSISTAGMLTVLATMFGQLNMAASDDEPKVDTAVGADGKLHVPSNYRLTYQSLGSWAVAAESEKGSKELHIVYASPGAVAAYRQTGHFPDGAVLVKEVFHASTGQMTTGTVSRAESLKGWFVMVRDNEGSHPGDKLWGDGWGWSWFDAPNASKTTSTDYKADGLSCHIPARASDWIYVGGYPPLKP